MKALLLATAAALALAATPASAQILGGGGIGGSLGGTVGGTLGGGVDTARGPVTTATRGTGNLDSATRARPRVDRRKGKAGADASTAATATGAVDGATRAAGRPIDASGGAGGSASAGGSAEARLVGTDAVRGTARSARETGRTAVDRTRDRAGIAASGAASLADSAGSASGSAGGSASGSAGGGSLVLAGSSAASVPGNFPVSPGMIVRDTKGRAIGKVQDVVATGRGTVSAVKVRAKDTLATIPAASLSGSGNALVSLDGSASGGTGTPPAAGRPEPQPAPRSRPPRGNEPRQPQREVSRD